MLRGTYLEFAGTWLSQLSVGCPSASTLKSVIETFRTVYSTHESGVPEHVRFESGAGFWHLSFSVCELCVRSDEGRG